MKRESHVQVVVTGMVTEGEWYTKRRKDRIRRRTLMLKVSLQYSETHLTEQTSVGLRACLPYVLSSDLIFVESS
jgi:hypothetical protein